MKHLFRLLLSLSFFTQGIARSNALEIPEVRNFRPEAMQAANQNWSVTQSPSRQIYAGNTSGIARFDGARWELLSLPDRQIVRAVAADSRGRIFWGGFGAFGYLDERAGSTGKFKVLSEELRSQKVGTEEIWHILVTEDRVFFQSFSALYEYDYDKVREIKLPGNIMFIQSVDGKILVPAIGQGIFVKTPNNQFELLPGTAEIGMEIIVGITAIGQGKLLIGTERRGMLLWEKGVLQPWNTQVQQLLKGARLNKILRMTDGMLAFGSVGEGLFISDVAGRIRYHIHRDHGLQNNTVLALFEDADGNLWAGLDKGLDLVLLNNPLRFSLDRRGSIGAVYTAAQNGDYLYLGSNQGLFFRHRYPKDDNADEWQSVAGISGQVWELTQVNGRLICGHNDGTFEVSGGTAEKISDVTGGWVLRQAPWDSTLWIQGTYTGLVAFRLSPSGEISAPNRLIGFSEPIEFMEFDAAGKLWAAHPYRGLHRLSLQKDGMRVTEIQQIDSSHGLPTEYNLGLRSLSDKLVLHAGENFLEWDNIRQQWKQLSFWHGYGFNGREKDLFSAGDSAFFCVYADHILRIGPGQKSVMNIRMVPDRPNILPFGSSGWLFCLEDGYAVWEHQNHNSNRLTSSAPIIHSAFATGKKGVRSISIPKNNQEAIEFFPDEPQISLAFSAMVFDRIAQYRWRMKGLQEEWSEWTAQSKLDFSFLPPGLYRLEVQSDLSDRITPLDFRVNPRWHQTWWFRLLLALFLIGTVLAALVGYQRRMEQRHKMQLLERERLMHKQHIEERNQQLQEDVLKKARDLANSTMQLIRKNEILMDIKQRVSELQRNPRSSLLFQQVTHLVDQELSSENDWALFEENFNSVHEAFLRKLKQRYPELTPGDLRLAAYLKMNLSSKEIAPLLGISLRGVENKRYRLRKKMDLPSDENLVEILMEL